MQIQRFDYSVDILQVILWQYNDAEKLLSLLQDKQDWLNENQEQFWTDWFNNVFNLQTANDFGLAVWAIILGMPLFINVNPSPPGKPIWGFGPYRKNFNRGVFPFSVGGLILTTEQKRLVLRLRYFQLITRGARPEINSFLNIVFSDLGSVYALDGLNMNMVYVFKFKPDPILLSVLQQYDLLPRPTAVGIKYVDSTRKTWGFGQYHKNFNNGTFING
jgi:uncharacterized protein DUF2612